MMSPEAIGWGWALAAGLLLVPPLYLLWPRQPRTIGEGDERRPVDLVTCERCGKPVLADAMSFHRRRCAGYLRSSRERSYQRRRW